MQLNGTHVVITGGTGGLGAALSAELRRKGAKVTTIGKDEGETIRANLADREEVARLCRELSAVKVDILIHNAGLQYFGRMHEQPESLIQAMVAVNLETPLMLTRAVLPGMLERNSGQIVAIGSTFAAIPFAHFGTYCATKGGMHAFTQSLRRELTGRGITITYAAPRAMRTGMSTGPIAEFLKRTHTPTDDPAVTAAKIVRGIAANKREIRIGASEGLFSRLNALCPALIDAGLNKHRLIAEEILPASSL